jgi:hypothetical protein
MKTMLGWIAGLAMIAAGTASPAALADGAGVKAGFLTCDVESGWGFVFGSSRDLKCEYSDGQNKSERYTGTINKFGVDIGYLSSAVIMWAVVAPSANVTPGSLAGQYAGASASAAVGLGIGANALVGGSEQHVVLQPVSIEGQTGLNVAGGITALTLKSHK